MKNKSSSTRDQILDMLKVQKRLTVSEIAKQVEITEMAVRRHLNTLERDQLIETTLVRQAMGRPINVYQLSKRGEDLFPKNYKSIIMDFMQDLEEISGQEIIDQLFERRQHRIKETIDKRLKNKGFDEKIKELAKIQNENGYMVTVSQDDGGAYHFTEYNCPITQVADRYNKACQCELELFQQVLGTEDIERKACISSGEDVCDYRIKPAK